MSAEYIDIPNCPKCSLSHRYKLEVDRSVVVKMITMDDMQERPRSVRVTRIFTCPETDEEFQGRLVLTDTSSDRIKNVTVVGVATDEQDA